jgi:hypothetical protein
MRDGCSLRAGVAGRPFLEVAMRIATLFHHARPPGAKIRQRLGSSFRLELVVGLLAGSAIVAFDIVAYFVFAHPAIAP